jgi:hypothetical protein
MKNIDPNRPLIVYSAIMTVAVAWTLFSGLIFINDEGTENGGLVFSGSKSNGKVDGSGHLSFDQYDQDQVVTLEQTEEDGQRAAGLTNADRPDADQPLP